MSETIINIARDFSRYPAGRVTTDGPNSGERFLRELLIPSLKTPGQIVIVLDGVNGYPSSFSEEAFGGLVRSGFQKKELLERIKFRYESPAYKMYEEDMVDAIRAGTDA